MLRAIPKEIIKHVCSYLEPTYRGCTAFGFQQSSSGKWQHSVASGLLELDTDSRTYTLVVKGRYSAWTSTDEKKIVCKGKWSVSGVDVVLEETTREITEQKDSKEEKKKKKNKKMVATLKRNDFHGISLKIPDMGKDSVQSDLYRSIWPEISQYEVNLLKSNHDTTVPVY